jgi:nitrite reductase/ring-hydroxylating ferredoxin subunit
VSNVAPGARLCRLDELDDPGAKGVSLGSGRGDVDIFLVRKDGEVRAYANDCPHAHTRLDHWPDRFLTLDETRIICANHAALFRIEDGFCTSGPCAGKSLKRAPVEIVDGMIVLAPEPVASASPPT